MRRADICAVAVAETFRGDGEILANPIGTIPMIGGRLARASFEPGLVMTDGEAMLVADDRATFAADDPRVIETWNPYRSMFDIVWSGRRHVIMGASQIDPVGNQNFAAIGSDYHKPKVQLRSASFGATELDHPGNTGNQRLDAYYVLPHHAKIVNFEP